MKAKIIGIIIICVLINAAAKDCFTENVFVPPSEFFINPETGEPNVVIVVGSHAASEDVEAATLLATTIGIHQEQSEAHFFRAAHKNIKLPNMTTEAPEGLGFATVDVPDAALYVKRDNTPITYTLNHLWYFDDSSHKFWGNGDGQFQPWETHEEIQIRFDSSIDAPCVPYLHGSNDNVHVPGIIYRADNIVVPPSIMVEIPCCYPRPEAVVSLCDCFGRRIVAVPEPWLIIHDMLPQFTLFNTLYTVVDGGAVQDINFRTGELGPLFGTPYILTGTPHFETETLYQGEPVHFGSYTVELVDVYVKRNMGFFHVSEDGEVIDTFWMVLDPLYGFSTNLQKKFPFGFYDSCNDLNGNKKIDPGEITNIINVPDDMWPKGSIPKKWIVDFIEDDIVTELEDIWADLTWDYYVDDKGDVWGVVHFTKIIIDGITLLEDGVEIQVYWLENEQLWYNHLCCDSWVTEGNFQQFLDAYQAGWDTLDENAYVYQPPGTGMWPPFGLQRSEMTTFIGNGFLDANDGHIGYEYTWFTNTPPEQDLNQNTNDGRTGTETIHNSNHDVEDPVLWHGPGPVLVEINISLCDSSHPPQHEWSLSPFKNLSHFTITVTDMDFCKGGIDYSTTMVHLKTGAIMADAEFPFMSWKSACDYNVILIGGPVANMVVKLLVDRHVSLIDWTVSPGEWELIEAPYGGCDILIVAGKDREATFAAVQELINSVKK